MKRACIFLLIVLGISSFPFKAFAIEDPLTRPNNKFGIHILFPTEIEQAAKLVNANGGEWGYVTIPIQSTDRDLNKWQKFMDDAKRLKIIPIIRIATYPYADYWIRTTIFDPVDFANFLDSLNWPTKNRYVIIWNEPNHGNETGGVVDAAAYAQSLSESIDAFKRVNTDFFIISAGLDPHAPNSGTLHENSYRFLIQMDQAVPGIFQRIDGFSSHPYPNGDFTADPSREKRGGINTFKEEEAFLQTQFGRSNIPIFLTETGWKQKYLSEDQIAQYYQYAFQNIFTDPNIVAVTPFLLNGTASKFSEFSFLKADGTPTKSFQTVAAMPKIKGKPTLYQVSIGGPLAINTVPTKVLGEEASGLLTYSMSPLLKSILKWFFP